MALPKPSTGLLPAENYSRFRAAFDAIDAATAAVAAAATSIGNEAQARASAIIAEAQARVAAIAQEAAARDSAAAALYEEIASEARARENTATGLYEALAREAENRDASVRGAYKAIAAGDEAEKAARETAIADLMQALADAIADLTAHTDTGVSGALQAISDLATAVAAQRWEFLRRADRPGDAPARFTLVATIAALGAPAAVLAPLPASAITEGDSGKACRLIGSGIVAQRSLSAVEPGRLYRARVALQRRANASDPSNDAVRAAVLWFDRSGNLLPPGASYTLIREWPALIVANGRVEVTANFARSAGDNVDIVAPPRARYSRIVAWTFGLDAVTDIEVLGAADVSDAYLLDPVSTDVAQRVTTIESQGLGPRLSAVESAIQAPSSLTFASRGDAAASTVPATVTTLALRGDVQAGDGRDGLYGRVASLPAGADGFTTQDGARWQRIAPAAEVMTALLRPWIASLPLEPPPGGGPYRNGDGLAWA